MALDAVDHKLAAILSAVSESEAMRVTRGRGLGPAHYRPGAAPTDFAPSPDV